MKFWADENFNGPMLRGLLTVLPNLDVIRVQDTGLTGLDDVSLLDEAAKQGAILLTHDAQTLIGFAYERVKGGLYMPGVIEVAAQTPIGLAIQDLEYLIGAGSPSDFENQVKYIPIQWE